MILTAMKALWKDHKQASENKIYLTKEGIEKFKKELQYLKEERLRQIEERIARIREEGGEDSLSVMAQVCLEQDNVVEKIEEIEALLTRVAELKANGGSKEVQLGSKVKIEKDGKPQVLELVESVEANPLKSRVSIQSPVGQALLGATVGQLVKVVLPAGLLAYKILEVS